MNKLTTDIDNVCHSQHSVSIPAYAEEADELRQALKLIQYYEKLALKEIETHTGLSPVTSDWHSIEYCVKNDQVIVIVKDGMIG